MKDYFPLSIKKNPITISPYHQDNSTLYPPPPPPGEDFIVTEITGLYLTTEDGIFLVTEPA